MPVNGLPTVAELAAALASGQASSRGLVEAALARIEDADGEGARAFLKVEREEALLEAERADRLRARGHVASPLAGLPVSIKDLFDVAGQVTGAGSTVLAEAPPAAADAPVVARLRAAGAILIGRTNMTEFAYSGVGLNPHYGTPGNPHDRTRIPGGSSSGAAVSVGDGMAVVGLGTDTGGSVRIPAAYCGIAGFKPTQARVPLEGAAPLSFSLDSIGPLAPSVACAAVVDSILAGQPPRPPATLPLAGLRLAALRNYVMDDLDAAVAESFERALATLSAAGAVVRDLVLPELDELPEINAAGGFAAAEAFAWHRDLLARRGDDYDPRVASRIRRGAAISAADYIQLKQARRRVRRAVRARTRAQDAVLLPTVANLAPPIAALASEDGFARYNLLSLRNTSVANFLDRPAATVPCQEEGALPVGLMVMGESGADRRVIDIAQAVESALGR